MGSKRVTTRPVRPVQTIEDIVAIESRPYDEMVPARSLYDLFLATADQAGDAMALTVLRSADPEDIGVALTHRQLLGEITRAANMFRALGVAPGRGAAAFLAPTVPELPTLLLGAQVAGVASSLNYLLARDAIIDLLRAQEATILVTTAPEIDETCWTKAQGMLEAVPSLRHVLVIGGAANEMKGGIALEDAMDGRRSDALDFPAPTDRDQVCALFHTGGTTGRPKLVQLTHGNQIHAAFGFGQVYGFDEQDVVINGFPFFHVGGTMTVGLAVLSAGGHVVVPSPYGLRPPAVIARYWEIAERFRATVVSGVPTSIAAMTNSWRPDADVSRVRMAGTGGAVLPKAVGERFEATTGIRLWETYGMTETAAAIAFNPGRGTPIAGSVGFRAPYSETRIISLDPERSGPCAPEQSGLVQVRGRQVFPGYLEAEHNVGVLDAEGWLTTGDVGYLTADQRLVLTGREKDLIVRSGHNIDPAAIEDVANKVAGVQISAAVGMPDEYAGEVPALFVVASPGAEIDLPALTRHMQTEVHEPPARPRSILVIDALPVTAVGKIFKPALRDLAIKEKVRLETERTCGASVSASIDIQLDEQKRTMVDVVLSGASPEGLVALEAALAPLPQSYRLRLAETKASEDPVLLSIEDGVAVVTINRPESLNALSNPVMTALERRIETLEATPGLRAVIITGAGRAFSAGGDLVEFDGALREGKHRLLELLGYNQAVFQRIEDLPVPVIGAANGLAVAGGLELLLCCDVLIAAEGARLGDGHVRYAIVPAGGATVRLGERVGPARAAQLFYTAELIDAGHAADWGLVNEVVEASRLMERAIELARAISERSPEAIRHVKALTCAEARSPDRAHRLMAELEHFARHVEGDDLSEGLSAFRAKRAPKY